MVYIAAFMHRSAIAVSLAFFKRDGFTAKRTHHPKYRLVSHSKIRYSSPVAQKTKRPGLRETSAKMRHLKPVDVISQDHARALGPGTIRWGSVRLSRLRCPTGHVLW